MPYTSDDLVSAVRMRCQLPDQDADGKFSDADIRELATEELFTTLLATLRGARGDYYVTAYDYTIASGVSDYRIPTRAQGASLRDLTIIDTSGNGYSVPHIPLEDADIFAKTGSFYWPGGVAHVLQGNFIKLRPEPTSSGDTLRVRYYQRPGRLVGTAEAMKVTGFGPNPTQVQGDVPASWTTSNIFDAILAAPNFDTLTTDEAVSAVTTGVGGSVTFTNPYPTELAVGDYIALATESPVCQLPVELYPALVSAACVRVLESLGDLQAAGVAQSKLSEQLARALVQLEPRNQGEDIRIFSRRSPLRFGRRWW